MTDRSHPYRRLSNAFARSGVDHVYWKARASLDSALAGGAKDLDLLTRPDHLERARRALSESGFSSFALSPRTIADSEGWLRWDDELSEWFFVHLHTALHAGHAGVFEQRLPLERALLDAVEPGPLGIGALRPDYDAVLLAIRSAFEPKAGKQAREAMARVVDADRAWRALLPAAAPPSPGTVPDRLRIREALGDHRGPRWEKEATRLRQSAMDLFQHRVMTRLPRALSEPPWGGLRLAGRGLMVSVVGADGAGKSTLLEALDAWLGVLLDVAPLYLGRGDWVSEAQQVAADLKWTVLERGLGRSRPERVPATVTSIAGGAEGASPAPLTLRSAVSDASRVALAGRRLRDLRRADRLRARGWVVLTDRFPHAEDVLLDGPGIPPSSGVRGVLRAVERRRYERFQRFHPDLLIHLDVSVEAAIARKPDHHPGTIAAKIQALGAASFPADATVRIDASQPAEEVLRQARNAIWARVADAAAGR